MIKVDPQALVIIKGLLKKYIPNYEVRAFGSRINGTSKEYSDLDLVVMTNEKIDSGVFGLLKEAFQESSLPFRVDLLDWNNLSEEFKEIIKEKYIIIGNGY